MYNFTSFVPGEPIDVTSLAKMSDYIAHINQKILSNQSSMSSPWGPENTRGFVHTEDMAIWTDMVPIVKGSIPNKDAERENWSAQFGITFRTIPIVTATPYCDTSGGGTIAPSCIWIHNITTTGVKGKWKWLGTTTKTEDVYALIIAIGEGAVA